MAFSTGASRDGVANGLVSLCPRISIGIRSDFRVGVRPPELAASVKKPVPFGKYYLLERINVGGMAEVFRAKAYGVEGFERLVAVKRILPNIAEDKEFIKMFIDEAKIAVQLNHANIAQIFDLGVVDQSYYIALEHVHGRDLRNIFDRCRGVGGGSAGGEPMPVAQACFVIMKICEGLDYAHNKRDQGGRDLNLVHRDVSPQNILVSFEGEVKLIDFGIAKAAGKGAKTQAGILKGKFGYMSPEQVRGLPVDRKSDIFSCGIVLYELLTGERLFVGESDFSTLEKVRNVEILPPSTYNRKIPDELERIVLKALAKDVEDRYQNAIDLHDELQAFVYTAGEFYSRKDLASWMKKIWGKEIEEETAKLESYRQLKPPPELTPGRQASSTQAPPSAKPPAVPQNPRRTTSMPSVPPPQPGTGGPAVAARPPPPPAGMRSTQGMPVVPMPVPSPTAPSLLAAAAPPAGFANHPKADLNWDDDELETQIYDNPEEEALAKSSRSVGSPAAGASVAAAGAMSSLASPGMAPPPPGSTSEDEPDLSQLVRSTSKGWGPGQRAPGTNTAPPTNGNGGHGPQGYGPQGHAGQGQGQGGQGQAGQGQGGFAPVPLASGSARTPSPFFDDRFESAAAAPLARDSSFDSMGAFGTGVAQPRKSRAMLWAALGGGVLIAAAVAIVILASGKRDKSGAASAPATAAATSTGAVAPPVEGDGTAGFDLYVTPATVASWRLDGVPQSTKPPVQIRKVALGKHQVAIDAPPGFLSINQDVEVKAGAVDKVVITLQPMDIVASFESTPPGAKVSLVVDGKRTEVGPTPASSKIDPREHYDVVFEKDGYLAVTKPLTISGSPEEKVVVNLERAEIASAGTPGPATIPGGGTRVRPPVDKPPVDKPPPAAKGEGTLQLGAKPPCEIFIDGRNTGLKTPQREIKLSAGKHKITLLNNEFGIKESFTVEIKADEPTKLVKDFSDRLPK